MDTMSWFVDTDWLQSRLGTPDLRIVQVGGESHYDRMHLPGAVLVSYGAFTVLRDGLPGMRADEEVLTALFGQLGIGPLTGVVAYDLAGGKDAARFIWTLVSMGHAGGVAILDGGLSCWLQEQRPLESQSPVIAPVDFIPAPNDAHEVDREGVLAVIGQPGGVFLLDTRGRNEYVGLTLRPPRGHLRGAVHLDWVEWLVGQQDLRLQSVEALRARLAAIGLTNVEQEVIVYCETGHRAALSWAVLRHLGWSKVCLFDGSMAEWRVYDLPVVYGENPG